MAELPEIPMRAEVSLGVKAAELWPLLSNTSRLNNAVGLPPVRQTGKDGLERKVETRLYGLKLSWREPPFEWVQDRYFRVTRVFDGGPIARFEGGMTLRDEDGGCVVTIDSNFTPRNALGAFLIKHATGKQAHAQARDMVERFGASLKGAGDAFPASRTKTPADAGALARAADRLHRSEADKEIAKLLVRHVEHGYDDELSRMRPFDLADRWGKDRLAALIVCLHAVKAGLLDLEWDILCPNCLGANERLERLSALKREAHCESCGIEYGCCFDEAVELRFSASATVRRVAPHTFCVGNPSQAPFAVAQITAGKDTPREVSVALKSQSYLVRELCCKKKVWLRPSTDGASRLDIDFSKLDDDAELKFAPGEVALTLAPRAEQSYVRVERQDWRDGAARASLVMTLQGFRDLFSSEVLAPGLEIGVRNVALLFTDLKGSTAMYEQVGDARAYSIVRDHFDYLFEIVERRSGAVIKTIGDAVMAAFARPADALAAALEMQERVAELNKKLAPKPPVVLKIGVHAGPSIAINGNGAMDYFGTTVNVAARVQNESRGGDVVVTEGLLCDPAARAAFEGRCAAEEAFEISLKGLSEVFKLKRLTPKAKQA